LSDCWRMLCSFLSEHRVIIGYTVYTGLICMNVISVVAFVFLITSSLVLFHVTPYFSVCFSSRNPKMLQKLLETPTCPQ